MEIESAAHFISGLLKIERRSLKPSKIERFKQILQGILMSHYKHHWFPDMPCKGSGYRCLRINHKMDPLIAQAGDQSGFDEADLQRLLPKEFTMWIDPMEVSYRIGDNGSICVLYDGKLNQFSPDVNRYQYHTNSDHSPFVDARYKESSRVDIRYPGCKESVRNNHHWDNFALDSRNRGMEQFATYVSS